MDTTSTTQVAHESSEAAMDQSAEQASQHTTAEPELKEEAAAFEGETEAAELTIEATEEENIVAKAQAEAAEWKDKYLRLYSEFENFRRRTQREKGDLILTAGEGVLVKLLPVLDDMERAEKATAAAPNIEALQEGMALVHHKMRQTLETLGLKPMNAAGQAFNPDLHEAITQIPAPTAEQAGQVLDEVERGYFLHEKPIRYAKVVIGQA